MVVKIHITSQLFHTEGITKIVMLITQEVKDIRYSTFFQRATCRVTQPEYFT